MCSYKLRATGRKGSTLSCGSASRRFAASEKRDNRTQTTEHRLQNTDERQRPRTTDYSREDIAMANQLGKMYVCAKCGSQVIVTKGGNGILKCCGQEMEQKK